MTETLHLPVPFGKSYFSYKEPRLSLSSAYHPQSDGQSEVVNRTLEQYLRCFVGARPKEWAKWLSLAEWWYNTCTHSTTKNDSSREAVYGVPPPWLLSYTARTTSIQAVEDLL